MEQSLNSLGNLLYSNVRIRHVDQDPAAGTLLIRAVYAEREEQKILYDGVLYSQIDKAVEGKRMALAVEIMPEECRGEKHQAAIARFRKDCGLQSFDSIGEISRRGYRLFVHYIEAMEDCIVIAKNLSGY